jgi:hypothetical protein
LLLQHLLLLHLMLLLQLQLLLPLLPQLPLFCCPRHPGDRVKSGGFSPKGADSHTCVPADVSTVPCKMAGEHSW